MQVQYTERRRYFCIQHIGLRLWTASSENRLIVIELSNDGRATDVLYSLKVDFGRRQRTGPQSVVFGDSANLLSIIHIVRSLIGRQLLWPKGGVYAKRRFRMHYCQFPEDTELILLSSR